MTYIIGSGHSIACYLSSTPANQPGELTPHGQNDSLSCSMYRTLVKLTGSLGAMLGADDHQRPATPGNYEQSSWQLNLIFGHNQHRPATPQI